MATLGKGIRDQFDWPLFVTASAIAVLGVTNLYSATSASSSAVLADLYIQQIYWLVLGAGAAVLVAAIDYRHFERFGWFAYGTGIVLLILVFLLAPEVQEEILFLELPPGAQPLSERGLREAIRFATADVVIALAIALFINASILVLAGATFHRPGTSVVVGIEEAYRLLAPALGAGIASTLFAVALLTLPYLKLVGGVLLIWIGVQLLVPEDDGEDGITALVAMPGFFPTRLLDTMRAPPDAIGFARKMMERSDFTAADVANAILDGAARGRLRMRESRQREQRPQRPFNSQDNSRETHPAGAANSPEDHQRIRPSASVRGRLNQNRIVLQPINNAAAAPSSRKRSAMINAVIIAGVAASSAAACWASPSGAKNVRAHTATISGAISSFTPAVVRISGRGVRLRHGIVMPSTNSVTGIVACPIICAAAISGR